MLSAVANKPRAAEPGVVLFVDDERRVLTSMKAMFRKGYRVLTANSAAEGLEVIARESVDVVVSDQRMPGMTGVEMLAQIKERSPRTMRILLTGYADLEAIEASINDCEVFRYLMKPCPPDQLRGAVAQALEAVRALEADVAANDDQPVPPSADVVVLHSDKTRAAAAPSSRSAAPAGEQQATPAAPAAEVLAAGGESPSDRSVASPARVDVLVLSNDAELLESICDAAQTLTDETRVHRAETVTDALDVLAEQPVGVLITDIAVSEDEVTTLTTELKREVPALVTILAAQRSDSGLLIDLINHGQVFRFLLKPIPMGQCRLWLTSARRRHLELASSAAERLRYQPVDATADELPEAAPSEITPEVSTEAQPEVVDSAIETNAPENRTEEVGPELPSEPNDHSAAGIRGRIGLKLNRLKARFSKWSQRNG